MKPDLKEFINVANNQITGKGTTEEAKVFIQNSNKIFENLKVEIRFGIGRASAIPWIAFLGYNQKVKDGIYPVFLYYKEFNLLILAYGVSATKKPAINWNNVNNLIKISSFFEQNNLKKPIKYGNSYIYKTYETDKEIDEQEINKNLIDIIQIYKNRFIEMPGIGSAKNKILKEDIPFNYSIFHQLTQKSNLTFPEKSVIRFTSSLITKPFVILTGLSGSGKTKLAQAFALWICQNKEQYKIVAVGADWTNREPLLGYPNGLEKDSYVKPDSGVLDLILAAKSNTDKPYFLILDEMNLSHVERYFADFLSCMESGEEILLHSGEEDWNGVPAKISLPSNLFIIGTVNIDETTYMFSPKVLDRANVIEFRVTASEMDEYLKNSKPLNLEELTGQGSNMAGSFLDIAGNKELISDNEEMAGVLINFFTELKKAGAEFGYRTASEIKRFAAVVNEIEPDWTVAEIIDAAIMQKLLPKLHGSRRKLEPVLKTLGTLCISKEEKIEDYIAGKEGFEVDKALYPVSLEKILRMYKGLIDNGFTSYAEA